MEDLLSSWVLAGTCGCLATGAAIVVATGEEVGGPLSDGDAAGVL